MAREYTVSFSEVATTIAADLFEIRPGDDKGIEIVGLNIFNSSDFGDAQAENIPYKIIRGHTNSGSGGTEPTARPVDPSDPAAGFAAEVNNTTAANGGTTNDLYAGGFNVAVGEDKWWPEGFGPKANQSNTSLVVRLTSVPVDSLDLSGTLHIREF